MKDPDVELLDSYATGAVVAGDCFFFSLFLSHNRFFFEVDTCGIGDAYSTIALKFNGEVFSYIYEDLKRLRLIS